MIVVGIGGEDGFVNYEVLERKRPTKKGKKENISQNPKDDMSNHFFYFSSIFLHAFKLLNISDGEKFEGWLEEQCPKLPEKSVIVMDNASYHTKLVIFFPIRCTIFQI